MEDNCILLYSQLLSVETKDYSEELVNLQEAVPELKCKYEKLDMQPYLGTTMLVRYSVAKRLSKAQSSLASKVPEAILLVVYGYRHPAVQEKYFQKRLESIPTTHSGLEGKALFEEVHRCVAVPEVAGHPTGAAVDLTILVDGEVLDMVTRIADFSNPQLLPTFANKLNPQQRSNRMLLRELMLG